MKFTALFKKAEPSWKELYEVGAGTYGEPTVLHWGEAATLKVGSYCSIADGVKIYLGGNHRTDWITTYPFPIFRESAKAIIGHPATKGDVIIGHDVWIGDDAKILSGVSIGNGAVIGSSAVVSSNVVPYSIVAGNPAKNIKMRFTDEEISILQALCWWSWDEAKLNSAMPSLLQGDVAAIQSFSIEYDQSNK
ncbi:MAG: CatB-related O-acetyltransferase [Gammaproteobacteria bacterium]|nr:CatB-related O-acetyltransferase [Gammaproteobacteria bacterium]